MAFNLIPGLIQPPRPREETVFEGHPAAAKLVEKVTALRDARQKAQDIIDNDPDPEIQQRARETIKKIDDHLSMPEWSEVATEAASIRQEPKTAEEARMEPRHLGAGAPEGVNIEYTPDKRMVSPADKVDFTPARRTMTPKETIESTIDKGLFRIPSWLQSLEHKIFPSSPDPQKTWRRAEELDPQASTGTTVASFGVPGGGAIFKAAGVPFRAAMNMKRLSPAVTAALTTPSVPTVGRAIRAGIEGAGAGALLQGTGNVVEGRPFFNKETGIAAAIGGGLGSAGEAITSAAANIANPKSSIGGLVSKNKQAEDLLKEGALARDLAEGPSGGVAESVQEFADRVNRDAKQKVEDYAQKLKANLEETKQGLSREQADIGEAHDIAKGWVSETEATRGKTSQQAHEDAMLAHQRRKEAEMSEARKAADEATKAAKLERDRAISAEAKVAGPQVRQEIESLRTKFGEDYEKAIRDLPPADVSRLPELLEAFKAERPGPLHEASTDVIRNLEDLLAGATTSEGKLFLDVDRTRSLVSNINQLANLKGKGLVPSYGREMLKSIADSPTVQGILAANKEFHVGNLPLEDARAALLGGSGQARDTFRSAVSEDIASARRMKQAGMEAPGPHEIGIEELEGFEPAQVPLANVREARARGDEAVRKAELEGESQLDKIKTQMQDERVALGRQRVADVESMAKDFERTKARLEKQRDFAWDNVKAQTAELEKKTREEIQNLEYKHGTLDDQILSAAEQLPRFRGKEGEDIIKGVTDFAKSEAEKVALKYQLTKAQMDHLVEVFRIHEMVNPKSLAPFAPMLAGRRNSNLYAHIAIPIRVRILAPAFKNLDDLAEATGISREWLSSMTMRANQASPDTVDKAMEEVESRLKPAEAVSNPVPSASPPAPSPTEDEEPYFQP